MEVVLYFFGGFALCILFMWLADKLDL